MSTSVFFQVKVETVDPPNLSTARARALPPKDLGKKIPEAFKPPEPAKPPESFKPPEPAKPPFKRPGEPAFKPPEVIATPRVIAPAQVGLVGFSSQSVGILGRRNIIFNDRIYSHKKLYSCTSTVYWVLFLVIPCFVGVDFGRFFFWWLFFFANNWIFGFNSGWFNPSRSLVTGRFFELELQEVQKWDFILGSIWDACCIFVLLHPKKGTRWFKSWPFDSRSLEVTIYLSKWSLNHPQKGTKTCQRYIII